MPVERIRINPLFLKNSGPILFIYGKVNDEFISSSDYVPKKFESVLVDYLQREGFERIVFFRSADALMALDKQSWMLSQTGYSSPSTRYPTLTPDLTDGRPLGSRDLFTPVEKETPEKGARLDEESSKPPYSIARGSLGAFSSMDKMIRDLDIRTAIIFPHFDQIQLSGEDDNQVQNFFREWGKLTTIYKNKCILVFDSNTKEDILEKLKEKEYSQLFKYLQDKIEIARKSNTPIRETLEISAPREDEILRMVHRRRLREEERIDWKKLDKIITHLAGKDVSLNSLTYAPLALPKENAFDEGALTEAMEELNQMIGLRAVKNLIDRIVKNNKYDLLRPFQYPVKKRPLLRNFVFVGNPGTGKTTVARQMGRIFKALGVIPTDKVVEVERRDLVAGYVGQTAIRTAEFIEEALGGILFIDEAYSLSHGGENDFGKEAIDTLNKAMEDNREKFIVIVAGYPDKMNHFLGSNPGLSSRFSKPLMHFEDYDEEELYAIFETMAVAEGLSVSLEAKKSVQSGLRELKRESESRFGNGREVRNFFDDALLNFKERLLPLLQKGELVEDVLKPEDIPNYTLRNATTGAGALIPSTGGAMTSRHITDAGRTMGVVLPPALPIQKVFQTPPRVYLAFAHDKNNHLPELQQECDMLTNLLYPLEKKGAIRIHKSEYTETDTIFREFNHFKNEICLLHYGGHANGRGLLLNTSNGNNEEASAIGLSGLFAQHKLLCVFLNGCATYDQVKSLMEANVKAVIATNDKVDDGKAVLVARAFYESLAVGKSLRTAFESAENRVKTKFPEFEMRPQDFRGLNLGDSTATDFPWGLYYQNEEVLNWCLPTDPHYLPRELTGLPAIASQQLIGKEAELADIHRSLQQKEPVLIWGMGGMGKSLLARVYLKQHREAFDHIIWINGQHGIKAGFLESKDLIHQLGLEEIYQQYRDKNELFGLIMNRLREIERNSLLIVDDLNDSKLEEFEALPKPPNWNILITSRQLIPGCEVLRLEKLLPEAAEALFTTHCHRKETSIEVLTELFTIVDYHPLAVELLAKTLETNFNIEGIEGLVARLKQPFWENPQFEVSVSIPGVDEERQILQHLRSIFSLAKDENGGAGMTKDQLDILRKFSVLPAQYIAGNVLQELILMDVNEQSQSLFVNELSALVKRGWLEKDEQAHFRAHPLIQAMCLDQLKPSTDDCAPVITAITTHLDFDPFKDRYLDKIHWNSFGVRLMDLFSWKDPQMIPLYINFCILLNEGGDHQRVISLLQEPLEYYLNMLDDDDPTTVTIQMQLGIAYRKLGRIIESKELMYRCADVFSRLMGTEDVQKAPEMMMFFQENLGVTHYLSGEYEESKKALESAINLYGKYYQEQNTSPQVLLWKILLSNIYRELGNYSEAASIAELARQEIKEVVNDERHPLVARANISIALTRLEQGEETEASKLLEDAHQILMEQYGEGHNEMAAVQFILCLLYLDQGKAEKSLEQLTQIANALKARYGALHPQYAECKFFMGLGKSHKATLMMEGDHDPETTHALLWEGLEDIGEATGIFQETMGPENPFQSTSSTELGLMAMGTNSSPEKIENLLAEGYQKNKELYGEQHLSTLDSQFGVLFFKVFYKGQMDVIPQCEQVLSEFIKMGGPENTEAGVYTILLSYCYKLAGHLEKAEELFEDGRDKINMTMGAGKWSDTMVNIFKVGFDTIETS